MSTTGEDSYWERVNEQMRKKAKILIEQDFTPSVWPAPRPSEGDSAGPWLPRPLIRLGIEQTGLWDVSDWESTPETQAQTKALLESLGIYLFG